MTYEYETEGFSPWSGCSLTDWLNERGSKGWMLATMTINSPTVGYDAVSYRAIWMRVKQPDAAHSQTKGDK